MIPNTDYYRKNVTGVSLWEFVEFCYEPCSAHKILVNPLPPEEKIGRGIVPVLINSLIPLLSYETEPSKNNM